MRALEKIRELLQERLPTIHRKRIEALMAAVEALMTGGRIACSELGRHVSPASSHKHGIKRIDRLLGNTALHGELSDIYRAMAGILVGRHKCPVILIDWTEIGRERCALVAALALDGRAVPVYSEAHPVRDLSSRRVQGTFLKRLKRILPAHVRPIIVTDAGFKGPWMKQLCHMNWDYICRVRGRVLVRSSDDQRWLSVRDLLRRAQRKAKSLWNWQLNRVGTVQTRLVLVDKRSKRARGRKAEPRKRRINDVRNSRRAREPWLLATSLQQAGSEQVAGLYRLRMQVEESIRDTKSHRLGWSFSDARSRSCRRNEVQLLLATIATVAAMALGLAAEAAGLQRPFQANTIRSRRVLSLFTLGRLVWNHPCSVPRTYTRRLLVLLHQRVRILEPI